MFNWFLCLFVSTQVSDAYIKVLSIPNDDEDEEDDDDDDDDNNNNNNNCYKIHIEEEMFYMYMLQILDSVRNKSCELLHDITRTVLRMSIALSCWKRKV